MKLFFQLLRSVMLRLTMTSFSTSPSRFLTTLAVDSRVNQRPSLCGCDIHRSAIPVRRASLAASTTVLRSSSWIWSNAEVLPSSSCVYPSNFS